MTALTGVDARVEEIRDSFWSTDRGAAWTLCDRHPAEATALRVMDESLVLTEVSYGELTETSQHVAGALSSMGVGEGDRVASLMGKSVELVTVLLGIWRTGAVYVPLFTAFAGDAVAERLAAARVRAVFVDAAQRPKVPVGPWRIIVIGAIDGERTLAAEIAHEHESPPPAVVGPGGAFVHMFTSGTTGAPKGVVHPFGYAAGWQAYLEFGLGVQPDGSFWCGADPGWAYGLYTAIVAPLAAGVPTVLLQGGFDADRTWSTMARLAVTDFAAAPTVYRSLARGPVVSSDDLALERLSSAGEPLTPDVNDWARSALGLEVHDHYGQTEVGMPIGFAHHRDVAIPIRDECMGGALPGWSVVVLDNDGRPVDAGRAGRLAIRVTDSPFMTFWGYVDGRGNEERFVDDGRYYLTGDTATMNQDRTTFRFSSRDDDVIIMAGYRIGPFDVESTLVQHDAIVECAVVGAPDPVRGEVIEAFVVLREGLELDHGLADDLRRWVKERYAAHAFPRRLHAVDALPRTESGKVRRGELRQRLGVRDSGR
ncbi:AMP-binding protein [Solicola gregarius]|uniref:AMP-binding protein n=1 Tax=Solicola gregarius TaxID=2908642 RepID=A0AA46TK18_9ACTN|nr:AMP-binding protein [Solicola gregarius]UYM06302.1 AMP-binding protein [Solicola gregarius]